MPPQLLLHSRASTAQSKDAEATVAGKAVGHSVVRLQCAGQEPQGEQDLNRMECCRVRACIRDRVSSICQRQCSTRGARHQHMICSCKKRNIPQVTPLRHPVRTCCQHQHEPARPAWQSARHPVPGSSPEAT
jgi:hypothetical protein